MRHERALQFATSKAAAEQSTGNNVTKTLAGPLVQKWMLPDIGPEEKEKDVMGAIDKLLLAATGFTKSTAPQSLPFPPAEIRLEYDQLEEIALEFVEDKHDEIAEVVRSCYSEAKSRHDQLISDFDQNSKTELLIGGHKKELATLKVEHALQLRRIKNDHQNVVSGLQAKIEKLEKDVKLKTDRVEMATRDHTKSLDALMKASLLCLKKRRFENKTNSEEEQ